MSERFLIFLFIGLLIPKEAWVARYPDEVQKHIQFKGKTAIEIAEVLGFGGKFREFTLENLMAREEKNKKLIIKFDAKKEIISFNGGWMVAGTGLHIADDYELFAQSNVSEAETLFDLIRAKYASEIGERSEQKSNYQQRVASFEKFFKDSKLNPNPEESSGGPPKDTPRLRARKILEKEVTGFLGVKRFLLRVTYNERMDKGPEWPIGLVIAIKGFDEIK
jgi:CRISPR/Cas system CSM-associated protein Csm5 (group 7 of RAMP superfamily)